MTGRATSAPPVPRATARAPLLRPALVGALLLLALAGAGPTLRSTALLTGSAPGPPATILTASLVLGATPASAAIAASALLPGDSTTGSVALANAGTTPLRYAMTSLSTNPDGKGLAAQLNLQVRLAGSSCAAFDGVEVYNGPLASAALGDPAPGDQGVDRTLGVSAGETICLRVTLPVGTPTSFVGSTTTATFTFLAEQTASNP
ncbi:MAG: hypothetical protein RL338_141 [Chloroflexota bacterium]